MEPNKYETEESNGHGWVELLILILWAHLMYPSKEMKPESQSDRICMQNEVMTPHMYDSEDLLNLTIIK